MSLVRGLRTVDSRYHYFLPLFDVGVKFDLLKAITEGRASIGFSEIKLSLISIFELQAKTSKLNIPPTLLLKQ